MLNLIQQFFVLFWQILRTFFNPFFLMPIGVLILICIKKNKDYKAGAYYQITKIPYILIRRDLGRYGEYLTYKWLKCFENDGAKFLFNVYIPKENGETTEIDVLMISKKGIFVFESKNYSGWIFGGENQKNWYQTLPTGRGRSHKELFYNPIMQNRSHIKYLKAFVGEQILMHSIIVFSERCTLKNVTVKSSDINVINRNQILSVVSNICEKISEDILTESDIANLYNKLYPCTQVSDTEKAQHIANTQNKLAMKSAVIPNGKVRDVKNKVEETDVAEPVLSMPVSDEINVKQETEMNNVNSAVSDTDMSLNDICPRCGGKLILKTAIRGTHAGNQFWGCANYPKCRYIKSVGVPEYTDNQGISST